MTNSPQVEAPAGVCYGRVYCITNAANGKQYVGQTVRSIDVRLRQHAQCSGRCRALEAAIKKHGRDAFSIQELCTAASQDELDLMEQFWIQRLGTLSPNGYNLARGGGGAGTMHEETKAIMSEIAKRPHALARFNAMRKRPDVIARQSQQKRVRWENPENKRRYAAAISAALNRPDVKEKRREALREAWAKPENKARLKAALARVRLRPEVQEKRSASLKRAWGALSEDRRRERAARLSVALRGHKKRVDYSPQASAARKAAGRKRAESPQWRANHASAMARIHADPDFIKRRNEAIVMGKAKARAARTHCRHGHEFTQQNTAINRKGARECRVCIQERRKPRLKTPPRPVDSLRQMLLQAEHATYRITEIIIHPGPGWDLLRKGISGDSGGGAGL